MSLAIAAAVILAVGQVPISPSQPAPPISGEQGAVQLAAAGDQLEAVPVISVTPQSGGVEETVAADYDAAVNLTNQYWATHFSEYVPGSYAPPHLYIGAELPAGLYDAPAETVYCGSTLLTDLNAWYCVIEDFVAFDIDLMLHSLTVGDAFIYFVVAHEWGHAIQARAAPEQRDQRIELQADCLAGAALQGMANDGTLVFEPGDSEELVAGVASLGDPRPWTYPGDHGSADERVGELTRGMQLGVAACLQPTS
ncbi:MAG: neutral zinc metallopeptidase [Microbacteriaceae bacterium]